MKQRKDDARVPTGPAQPLSHSPFAQLSQKLGELPAAPAADARDSKPAAPPSPAVKPAAKGPLRAVVRMERKGRGGKEVTIVEQLGLREKDLQIWLKALKGSLGCGGAVEGDTLLLQGDHRPRVKALLEERGVGRVTVG